LESTCPPTGKAVKAKLKLCVCQCVCVWQRGWRGEVKGQMNGHLWNWTCSKLVLLLALTKLTYSSLDKESQEHGSFHIHLCLTFFQGLSFWWQRVKCLRSCAHQSLHSLRCNIKGTRQFVTHHSLSLLLRTQHCELVPSNKQDSLCAPNIKEITYVCTEDA
jgi:hypothetical protein